MLRRIWQKRMIALAVSPRMKHIVQGSRATSQLSRRYVAGETAGDGVQRAQSLLDTQGIRSSLFYLGEYVDTRELVAENVAHKLAVAELLGTTQLDVHISGDPTQLGLGIDDALISANVLTIGEAIKAAARGRPGIHGLMLDMEDASVTDRTIAAHRLLVERCLPAALTVQAYLRRTETDLRALVQTPAKVRLVKGAFAAGEDISFTRQDEIKANSRKLIDIMFSPEAKASGFYPIIATHDDRLHRYTIERARANGWKPGDYEFEMLLGVRGDVAQALARAGKRVRLYVPFGRDWWPYAVRRIGENPRNGWLLARSLFG